MEQTVRVCAVVVAAGRSTRCRAGDKLFLPIGGVPVLALTLRALDRSPVVDGIIVVAREDRREAIRTLLKEANITKPVTVTDGGETRAASALAGVRAAEGYEIVLVQDGARPFVTPELIERVAAAAAEYGAAVPVVPVKDTVKTRTEDGFVQDTPPRSALFAAQTPQGFRRELYLAAAEVTADDGREYTDDASLFEAAGYRVKTVEGEEANRKITTDADFGGKGESAMTGFRIGHGYDVHRLTAGRPLILGGVTVPYEKGLEGHSDADVLLHAVSDALLGAAALGDIGKHFPDTDERYRGIDSRKLLRETVRLIREAGFQIGNLDATVLAQKPKLCPYMDEMRANLAADCELPVDAVSVKATTEEGLGFTGAGEGIAAHAVALLTRA